MELQLNGKRALVTGSTSGIGEQIAKTLAGGRCPGCCSRQEKGRSQPRGAGDHSGWRSGHGGYRRSWKR